ncbi:hypothetical protein EG68_02201 [Paragonimus skrjabini miyazakii]|uniref:DUF4806 domain-containing protein n=1 Tax=Paragonimus skrjabini miyazakii TaxID=59628 RepID=A0A8S9Z4E8_9TREM|nr:hypothetical protein EG68_02201 [Paragonimus skrjabini miyazakii]
MQSLKRTTCDQTNPWKCCDEWWPNLMIPDGPLESTYNAYEIIDLPHEFDPQDDVSTPTAFTATLSVAEQELQPLFSTYPLSLAAQRSILGIFEKYLKKTLQPEKYSRSDDIASRRLAEEVISIKRGLRQLAVRQKHVISKLVNLCASIESLKRPTASRSFPLCLIRTRQELDVLENTLVDQTNFDSFVHSISKIGGKDLRNVVGRILASLVHKDIAKTINWRGINGKIRFSTMRLTSAIKDGVMHTAGFEGITGDSVEKYIKRWFKNAGGRNGGRYKRHFKVQPN